MGASRDSAYLILLCPSCPRPWSEKVNLKWDAMIYSLYVLDTLYGIRILRGTAANPMNSLVFKARLSGIPV